MTVPAVRVLFRSNAFKARHISFIFYHIPHRCVHSAFIQVEVLEQWEADVEKVTEEDEESNADDSSSSGEAESEEDSEDTQASPAADKKKTPSKAPSTASVESLEADQRGTEEYDQDVSSRGRLRKRRLIPNNSEDQGVRKKKVAKKAEEAAAEDGNENVGSGEWAKVREGTLAEEEAAKTTPGGQQQQPSSHQVLAAAGVSTGPQLLQKLRGPPVLQGALPATAAGPSSHPVMQKMLRQVPLVAGRPTLVQQGAMPYPPGAPPLTVVAGPGSSGMVTPTMVSTSPTVTVSRAAVAGAAGGSGRSLLVSAIGPDGEQRQIRLDAKQQQELLRQGVFICRVSAQKDNNYCNIGGRGGSIGRASAKGLTFGYCLKYCV